MQSKELEIIVPWGHIAVKTWGDEKNTPVLAIHGFMDNAGTFDRIIEFLPKSFYYICVDLPGHGKSSHLPSFFPYFTISFVLVYKLLMKHFGRKSYIIMGHSYGGQIALLYAQLYPNCVDKLIMLDCIHLFQVYRDEYIDHYLKKRLDSLFKIYEKGNGSKVPFYTYEEVLQRIIDGRPHFSYSCISREAAEAVLPRSVIKVGENKYKFISDQRMKYFINPLHDSEYSVEVNKQNPLTCPTLFILAEKSLFQNLMFNDLSGVFNENKLIQFVRVEGGHDVHNNNPEVVGPIVAKFLLTQRHKL